MGDILLYPDVPIKIVCTGLCMQDTVMMVMERSFMILELFQQNQFSNFYKIMITVSAQLLLGIISDVLSSMQKRETRSVDILSGAKISTEEAKQKFVDACRSWFIQGNTY